MPRGHPKTGGNAQRAPRRGTRARGTATQNDVPDVFRDMLAELPASDNAQPSVEEPPLKRRRLRGPTIDAPGKPSPANPRQNVLPSTDSPPFYKTRVEADTEGVLSSGKQPQTVSDDSDESDEDDVEWEEVGLDQAAQDSTDEIDAADQPQDISVVLDDGNDQVKKKATPKRKGMTAMERRIRLDTHKVHFLCLLMHAHIRNNWCNDEVVQRQLRRLVHEEFVSMLNPSPTLSQFDRSRAFIDGLANVLDIWYVRYKITAVGIRKAQWAAGAEELSTFKLSDDVESPMERSDFWNAARTLEGSADLGAQLFCALLRSVGVKARLVCSLQPLPFSSASQASARQTSRSALRNQKRTIYAADMDNETAGNDAEEPASISSLAETTHSSDIVTAARNSRIRRFGQMPSATVPIVDQGRTPPSAMKQKNIPRSKYPVYWVEAFNTAHQKWLAVDVIATKTVGKPSRLEPPLGDRDNSLSYAVAFEDDGVVKDVTRRYAKAYNAKTRKSRVESTEEGTTWNKKALTVFKRGAALDRDQVEDAEFARKEAAEGLPRNVQDYKDHPYYVLERHLKHNEIIHPKHECGKVTTGGSHAEKTESIYRRQNVHVVRSADKWFRLGRDVKAGEQPLKHRAAHRLGRGQRSPNATSDNEDDASVALYAAFQTELYVPPPVVKGRVPRNAFGNLDIYVPSMIPSGGVHIAAPDARKAARLIGVDYADAVTGFQFKGRHGTAVVQGIVVAKEFEDAVKSAVDCFEYAKEQAALDQRTVDALRIWRRFVVGLRILERVRSYGGGDGEGEEQEKIQEELEQRNEDIQKQLDRAEADVEEAAGGFFPEDGFVAQPTAGNLRSDDEVQSGGFLPENENLFGFGSSPSLLTANPRRRLLDVDEDATNTHDSGGGFLPQLDGGNDETPRAADLPDHGSSKAPETNATSYLKQRSSIDITPHDQHCGGFFADKSYIDTNAAGRPVESNDTLRSPDSDLSTPRDGSSNGHSSSQGLDLKLQDALPKEQPMEESDVTREVGALNAPNERSDLVDSVSMDAQPELSESDRGSLLSHDPEDEDADPEWLNF